MAADLQPLIDSMTRAATLEAAAVTFIEGVPAKIEAAVSAAIANGATEAQLAPINDLRTSLETQGDALANALFAGTGGPVGAEAARKL
jgi:hypothetical protein